MKGSEDPKSNPRDYDPWDYKLPKISLYMVLSLWLVPSMVYLLLIIVVVASPKVMISFGLQPFVDYVAYELQPEAYSNLLTRPSCLPEMEVYFFYVQAASILIIGSIFCFVSILVLLLARAFPNAFYNPWMEFEPKKYKFCRSWIILFLFFLSTLWYLHPGPVGALGSTGCGTVTFRYILAWMTLYWLYFFLNYIAYSYFTTRKIVIRRGVMELNVARRVLRKN